MNDYRKLPREPLPASFRPAWVYIGLMGLLVLAIAAAAALTALCLQ